MSYYIQNDGRLGEQLASNTGWGDFGRWCASIDKKHAEVKHLFDSGWSDDPRRLLSEIEDALKSSPPPDADTLSVVKDVIDAIKSSGAKTVVSITDGFGNEESETDEE